MADRQAKKGKQKAVGVDALAGIITRMGRNLRKAEHKRNGLLMIRENVFRVQKLWANGESAIFALGRWGEKSA